MELPQTLQGGNFQAILWRGQPTGPLHKFFTVLAGRNQNGKYHKDFVRTYRYLRQREVSSPEASDYFLVLCPSPARVRADLAEALHHIHVVRPIVVVVMHDTAAYESFVDEGERRLDNPNVCFITDVLLNNGKVSRCNRNRPVWFSLGIFLADSQGFDQKRMWIIIGVTFSFCALLGVIGGILALTL